MARIGALIALIIVVIIIIAAVIGGAYYYLSRDGSDTAAKSSASTSGRASSPSSASVVPVAKSSSGTKPVDPVTGVAPNADATTTTVDDDEVETTQTQTQTQEQTPIVTPPLSSDPVGTAGGASLTEVMGIHPASKCPSGTCLYGIIRATGSDCRALGGAMNGTPGDTEWTDCHVNFGRDASRGFLKPGSCPGGTCQYGVVSMTGASCRALGGAMNGSPGDGEQTNCHFNIGATPQWGLYAPNRCPEGSTCFPALIKALGSQCRAVGGTTATDTDDWTECDLNMGIAQ